ncbi:MAG: OmpA family protein [Caulobacteraceae bacterium]
MMVLKQPGKLAACLAVVLAGTSLAGCATKGFVRSEVAVVDGRLTETQGQVNAVQGTLGQHDTRIASADATARDAMTRADAAGKLAEGKFNYTVLMTDDAVKFPANGAKLSTEAQARLQSLAEKLKTENKNVYIEVQGYTDAREADRIGAARADAVRKFLSAQGVPLSRISSISYGASNPVAPNKTATGRAQNRRVVVNVLS